MKGLHARAALFYICLQACLPATLRLLWPHDVTVVSQYSYTCLPLVSLLSGYTLLLWPRDFTLVSLVSSTLWVLWPHDFTLFSFTLGALRRMNLLLAA